MFTLVGFDESEDGAGVFVNLAGIPDDHITVTGDDIIVPALNQVVAYAALVDLTVAAQALIRSPRLLERGHEEFIEPVASGLTFGAIPEVVDRRLSPLMLDVAESLQARVLDNPAVAARRRVLVWLADGPIAPIRGDIETVRVTAAVAAAAGVWTNGALTFPSSLKAGRYQLVGARCVATNSIAYRFRFPGYTWRPGGPVANAQSDTDLTMFRNGEMGVWGEFEHRNPPTVDILGITDTAETLYLDLIHLG
jgi:hypothetical protein